MPMKIIEHRKTVTEHEFSLHFQEKDAPDQCGYGFPCDEHGRLIVGEDWTECMSASLLDACTSGRYAEPVVQRREWSYVQDAVGECHCGRTVQLTHFTNTCECGTDYNFAGQRLAPREQWGEETGEHWSECY